VTENPDLDAIVIGAGMAGLAAADALVTAGRRVIVLEARDRPGGRALTHFELGRGVPLELGAQMVHGRTVITHRWLAHAGLSVRHYPTVRRSRIVVDGRVARYPWLFLPFHPIVGTRSAWSSVYAIPRALLEFDGADCSLEQFLDARSVPPAVRPLVTLLHGHVYATDLDQIGVRGQAEEDALLTEAHGFHNFLIDEGYSTLVDRISARLGDRIILRAPVREIGSNSHGVSARVVREDGTRDRDYTARAVIVTVPLSLLKAETIAFDPPLPAAKRAAIRRIGFGQAYALHLKLRDGRFRERLGDFAMVYGGTASSFYRPRVGLDEPGEFLTAFTVGREAERRARLSDEGMVAATVDEWNGMMPAHAALGAVEGSAVHRWPVDPWTRGAYSFLPPEVTLEDRRVLAAPVDGRFFFAGEATDAEGHAATVAGALASGTRAAREVLEHQRDADARPK
jgi:polyamine oxidase